jgi:FMN phosphatase YigB (HAD superfamily)
VPVDTRTWSQSFAIRWSGASECLFIDDRAVNVECADQMGIPTIQFHDPDQLKDDLERRGVTV